MVKSKFVISVIFFSFFVVFIQNAFSGDRPLAGENWDNFYKWSVMDDQKSKVDFKEVDGKDGTALELKYKLKGDAGWVVVVKQIRSMPSKDTPILFNIKADADSALEVKVVDKDNSVFGRKYFLKNNFKDWTQIAIFVDELDYWWGGDEKFNEPKELQLALSGSGGGTVILDQIGYGKPEKRTKEELVSSNWDNIGLWQAFDDGKSSIDFKRSKGKVDEALQLKYNIKENNGWVAIVKRLNIPLTDDLPLTFYIKANSAAALELKFVDADGSNFGLRIPLKGSFKNWTPISVSLDDVSYLWGGDESFDRPKEFSIAISGAKGAGVVELDEIGYGVIK